MSDFHCIVLFRILIISTIFSQFASGKSEEDEEFSFSTAWETFWSVSCEFSDLLESESTRQKRSLRQEPNFEDPVELFNYLYPLADVKPEDYMSNGEQRSGHSFIQDLIDLWGSECHSRINPREKRDVLRRDSGPPNYNLEDETEEDNNPYHYETSGSSDDAFKNSTTTTTTPTPAPAEKRKEKKAIPDTDTFFAQYGGDIEYFFPLISFGIPFDGEITFLGFHGFKGLFPYK